MRTSILASLAVLLWTVGIEAIYGIDGHAKAAYFTTDTGYVFALNAVANGDIFFHMSGPATNAWLGMGIGSHMKGSFMIVAYPASNGHNVTISTRIASGHHEPTYDPSFEIIKIYNDTYAPNANTVTDTGVIIAHALCRNCSRWSTGFLDTTNSQQPFLFALGPEKHLADDSPAASIPLHAFYGQYTIDMPQATNASGWYGRVPAPNVPDFVFPPSDIAFGNARSTIPYNEHSVDDHMPSAHAALMCIAFVAIFPIGAIVMRLVKRALWHGAVQGVGFAIVLAGLGVGIKVSRLYNKSRDFKSAHQAIGLIVIAGLCVQLGLGLVHHSMYVKSEKPTMFGKVHMFLGPSVMLLGLVNAGLGFDFAGKSHLNIPYVVVVIIIAIIVAAVFGCTTFCRSRRQYRPERQSQQPQYYGGYYTDYELPRHPTFGEQPPEPYEPTTPYTATAAESPYTPLSAYTPTTPKTWRKEEITNWPHYPYKQDDFI